MIKLEHVSKIYQTKDKTISAVDDVSLEIAEGDIFGIIGYSGAGKSTLLRLLNLLEVPTSGKVIVSGQDLTTLGKKELLAQRQKIGMIFQHFNLLWSRTVKDNILLPLEISGLDKNEQEVRVTELIRLVGLEGREDSFPSELSGGQKQRVGIARSLATNPSILLADEATSALDPETTQSILTLLKKINQEIGITIVLITHQMEVIQEICHHVAVMEDGHVIEQGEVLDVFLKPQHETTKRFVQQLDNSEHIFEAISKIKSLKPQSEFLQLTFLNDSANKPILNDLARQTDAAISIFHGNITQTATDAFGQLIVQIDGNSDDQDKVKRMLSEQNIDWKVI